MPWPSGHTHFRPPKALKFRAFRALRKDFGHAHSLVFRCLKIGYSVANVVEIDEVI